VNDHDALLVHRACVDLFWCIRPLARLSKLLWAVTTAGAAGPVIATFGQFVMIVFVAVLNATLLHGAGLRIGAWDGVAVEAALPA
jgi:hypothetical protein